jgi:CBS domain-containing protein
MATRHLFILPVVQAGTGRLVGLVTAEDVLQGRPKAHERETRD